MVKRIQVGQRRVRLVGDRLLRERVSTDWRILLTWAQQTDELLEHVRTALAAVKGELGQHRIRLDALADGTEKLRQRPAYVGSDLIEEAQQILEQVRAERKAMDARNIDRMHQVETLAQDRVIEAEKTVHSLWEACRRKMEEEAKARGDRIEKQALERVIDLDVRLNSVTCRVKNAEERADGVERSLAALKGQVTKNKDKTKESLWGMAERVEELAGNLNDLDGYLGHTRKQIARLANVVRRWRPPRRKKCWYGVLTRFWA